MYWVGVDIREIFLPRSGREFFIFLRPFPVEIFIEDERSEFLRGHRKVKTIIFLCALRASAVRKSVFTEISLFYRNIVKKASYFHPPPKRPIRQ